MAPRRFGLAAATGVLTTGWSPDRMHSLVDLNDVTDVALAVLTDSERHAAATYELVGPGRYTAYDMAAIMTQVLGRAIRVEEVDADAYFAALYGDRDRRELAHELRVAETLRSRYSSHDFVGNANVLTWLLGRTPTSFEQFVATYREPTAK